MPADPADSSQCGIQPKVYTIDEFQCGCLKDAKVKELLSLWLRNGAVNNIFLGGKWDDDQKKLVDGLLLESKHSEDHSQIDYCRRKYVRQVAVIYEAFNNKLKNTGKKVYPGKIYDSNIVRFKGDRKKGSDDLEERFRVCYWAYQQKGYDWPCWYKNTITKKSTFLGAEVIFGAHPVVSDFFLSVEEILQQDWTEKDSDLISWPPALRRPSVLLGKSSPQAKVWSDIGLTDLVKNSRSVCKQTEGKMPSKLAGYNARAWFDKQGRPDLGTHDFGLAFDIDASFNHEIRGPAGLSWIPFSTAKKPGTVPGKKKPQAGLDYVSIVKFFTQFDAVQFSGKVSSCQNQQNYAELEREAVSAAKASDMLVTEVAKEIALVDDIGSDESAWKTHREDLIEKADRTGVSIPLLQKENPDMKTWQKQLSSLVSGERKWIGTRGFFNIPVQVVMRLINPKHPQNFHCRWMPFHHFEMAEWKTRLKEYENTDPPHKDTLCSSIVNFSSTDITKIPKKAKAASSHTVCSAEDTFPMQ